MQKSIAMQLSHRQRAYLAGIAATMVALATGVWLASARPVSGLPGAKPPGAAYTLADPEARWGVRVIGIRRTAADYMLDFRFRMLDPDKAAAIMDRRIRPQLIVEKTGRTLGVPVSAKIGPLRQSAKFAKADRNYFMFFANPGRAVQAGDRVTVVIGDFKAEHLVVE